jgi:hypothetical protein
VCDTDIVADDVANKLGNKKLDKKLSKHAKDEGKTYRRLPAASLTHHARSVSHLSTAEAL